jgi:YHS domain-containing protein
VKLLLLIIIAYLAYRAGKSWLMRYLQGSAQDGSRNLNIDDVMVKDPVCGIYFPRREGLELHHGGNTYVFCSAGCRDRFLREQAQ